MNRRERTRRRDFGVEALETRGLLSVAFAGGVWSLNGTGRADTLVVDRDPAHPGTLRAFQNGKLVGTRDAATVVEIRLVGRGGNDTLKVDESHGAITARAVLLGGAGRNSLYGGSGTTVLDGGPGRNSLLQPGTGPTTVLRGVSADSVSRFGSTRAFRQFLAKSAAHSGSGRRTLAPPAPPGATAGGAAPTSGGAKVADHSTTRVQVAGVDEPDIVETDGSYLYLLSRDQLVVVDARQPDAMAVASRTPMNGSPLAEYLDGDRLTVITGVWNATPMPGAKLAAGAVPALYVRGSGQVKVTTFDVSDPSKPRKLLETSVDGNYSDSRLVNGKLYLVLQNDLFVGAYGGGPVMYASGVRAAAGTSASPAKVANAPLNSVLPSFSSAAVGAGGVVTTRSGLVSQPGDIYRAAAGDDANLMSVVVLNTRGATPGPVGTASLLGSYASTLHVTPDSLYVFSPRWDEAGTTTTVSQFALAGGGNPTLVASGSVPGTLVDQYSADAYRGDLRVATTNWDGGTPTNGVYVLRPQAGRLAVIGKVEGIAKGESLYAARFEGEVGYLDTFEQVDPLHTLDLSDPARPKVVGELVMTGYARQLIPVGDHMLVGIGREADAATGRTTGLKVSLFDVGDLAHPALVASQVIAPAGTEWAWSGAEWDPHALGWFPEKGLLAIPVAASIPPADASDPSAVWTYRSELYVYHLDTAAGASAFDLLGTIAHTSDVSRSVRIEDVLYSIAGLDVKSVRAGATKLDPLGTVVIQTDDGSGTGVPVPIAVAAAAAPAKKA